MPQGASRDGELFVLTCFENLLGSNLPKTLLYFMRTNYPTDFEKHSGVKTHNATYTLLGEAS